MRATACPSGLFLYETRVYRLVASYAPSMTSTGNLNLSKAPFLRRSLLSVTCPADRVQTAFSPRRIIPTLTDSIIDLVHVQVLNIRGKDAVEQLYTDDERRNGNRNELRTMFKTSFPGSDHQTMVGGCFYNRRFGEVVQQRAERQGEWSMRNVSRAAVCGQQTVSDSSRRSRTSCLH